MQTRKGFIASLLAAFAAIFMLPKQGKKQTTVGQSPPSNIALKRITINRPSNIVQRKD